MELIDYSQKNASDRIVPRPALLKSVIHIAGLNPIFRLLCLVVQLGCLVALTAISVLQTSRFVLDRAPHSYHLIGKTHFLGCGFSGVLEGRNADLSNGVERALRRKPRDFAAFAH
jgi:hypothetical protein